jgi:hypothetical protein
MPRNSRALFPRRIQHNHHCHVHHSAAPEREDNIHDLNATALSLLGLKHTWLTYRLQGLDYRLPDSHGEIAQGVLV